MGQAEEKSWVGPGYRDLLAWQKALDLADLAYDACEGWPKDETYGLAGQTKRAAVSIAANIAEGQERGTPGDFDRFLTIAYDSLCEFETLAFLAHRRRFIDCATRDDLLARSTEVARLIHGLKRSLGSRRARGIQENAPLYDEILLGGDDVGGDF